MGPVAPALTTDAYNTAMHEVREAACFSAMAAARQRLSIADEVTAVLSAACQLGSPDVSDEQMHALLNVALDFSHRVGAAVREGSASA